MMTDTHFDPGVRGHTRSTWRDENHLRGVLLRLVTEHPEKTRDELKEMYLAKVEMVPALVEEALVRAFDNDWAQAQKPTRRSRPLASEPEATTGEEPQPARQPRPRPSSEEAAAAKAATEAAVTAAVEHIKSTVLLDSEMPNGKKLRDCTGADVRQLETQIPAWLGKLAGKVKPDQIVGEVLSEAEVRSAAPKDWT